ncbi:synaptosomal-associated protein 29 [Hydra vulgaris]|uniref:Synaptosomal-associated protein 29 n=1 Tax=Hydra vulgaris TaxID=6087 RepID=T2MH77_HYDVU|nr:synaptosomal-associated protein 29-like [Hydra vulgaris]
MATNYGKSTFNEDENFEDISDTPELARLKQQKELYEQRMIDSSFRSLRLINESQATALETAAELESQRLQLERTHKNLNKMDADLNQSDRHINSIKSIWGSVENWFKKPANLTKSNIVPAKISTLSQNVKNENAEIKNNLNVIDKKVDLSWSNEVSIKNQKQSTNQIVDENLDQMLSGLKMLKSQALALGTEIDYQNDLIADIHVKAEKVDQRVDQQNLKIQKILR